MGQRRIGVVAALPEEIRPLQQRLDKARRLPLGRNKALQGSLGEVRLVTLATGDGGERARRGLTDLLSQVEVEAVIVIGIAGGLSADLEVGDVVVITGSQIGPLGSPYSPPPKRNFFHKSP